jgi:branched-chain amino acid transport system substrate-binding protein
MSEVRTSWLHGRRATALATVALFALAGAFRGPAGSAAPTTGNPDHLIRLGAAMSETGDLADEGKLLKDGYDFTVDWINHHGGVEIHGVTYTFAPIKYYDDESKAAQSAALVDKLATQDHITLILGPYSSPLTVAAAAVSSKDGAVLMASGGTAKAIWGPGIENVVGPNLYANQYAYPVIDALLAAGAKIKTMYIMHADDVFSAGVAKGAAELAKAKGIEVLGDFQYPANTTDVSSILAEMKQSHHADLLLTSGHVQDGILITRQAKQADLNFNALAITVAPTTPAYVKALGKDAEDVISPAPWVPQENFKDPFWGTTRNFVRAFEARYHYEPDYHVAFGVEGVELFAEAIRSAGGPDPAKVSAAFRNVTYQTVFGPVQFNGDLHETNQSGAAIQIQGGKPVPIWPAQYVKDVRYPMPTWSQR